MEEHLKTPPVREMLANVTMLLNSGKTDAAMNMAIVAATQARISFALSKKIMADACIQRNKKGDKEAAKAFLMSATDILCSENVEEKIIQDNIKDQLSKLT